MVRGHQFVEESPGARNLATLGKNELVTDSPDSSLPDPTASSRAAPPTSPPVPPVPPAADLPPALAYPAQGEPPAVQPLLVPRTEGSAVAALVCAILAWFVVPIVLAIVALVLARSAEKAIDARPTELSGRGLVTGARWVAWVHLVLVAMVVAFLAAFAIAVWVGR